MSLAEAARIVTAFAAGDEVEATILRQAISALRDRDPSWAEHLRRRICAEADTDVCDLFLANLAEFCEMTAEERISQMPDLVDHICSCDNCRRSYRTMHRRWIVVESAMYNVQKELAAAFRIVVDKASRKLSGDADTEILFGTPSLAYAVPMGASTIRSPVLAEDINTEPALRKEWVFADEESGFSIRLVGVVKPEAEVLAISGQLVSASGQTVLGKDVLLEVREADCDRLVISGKLGDFLDIPLELPVGNWVIGCQYNSSGTHLAWKLLVEVRGREADTVS